MSKNVKNAGTRQAHGGRPRKFSEPSQPITVTLPTSTLEKLAAMGKDRAKAIATAVDKAIDKSDAPVQMAEVINTGEGIGLVLVGPSKYLASITGLRMVEIMPGRYLLTIKTGMAPALLEVAMIDMLEKIPASEQSEKAMLAKLVNIFRSTRQASRMNKEEILIVNTRK